MKKLALRIAFLSFCVVTWANMHAQTTSVKSVSLTDALKRITRVFGTEFIYDKQLLQAKTTSYNLENIKGKQVEDVLKAVLYPNDFVFLYIKNNYYTIVPKDRVGAPTPSPAVVRTSAPVALPAAGQQSTVNRITGTVFSNKTEPVSGASISAQHAGTGTTTDNNGQFTILVKPNDVLVISSVGFQAQEVRIGSESTLRINLESQQKHLDEVVVIGYGTTTARRSTGSVSSITAAEIGKQPVGNPLATLPGRIAGTLVAQNNGLPGSAVQLQIRGQGSLSSGTIPLYVIDGVPFTNFNGGSPATDNLNAFGVSGASGGISPFGMINPADIERIDILKDADATSIYGSRGANGVVLITTKRGKAGKTRLDFNVRSGTTRLNRYIPMLGLQEYLALRREAFKNDGITPNANNAPDLLVWDTTKATDWQRRFLGGTGNLAEAQATLSGGDARTRFLFNTSYRRESTIFPGDNADKRFSTRLNVEHTSVNGKFNASFNASYSNANTNLITSDISSVYNLPPNLPLYDTAGKLFWAPGFTNPLSNLIKRYKGTTTNLIGNAVLRYTILPGLNLKSNFGYTTTDLDQNTTNPASSQNPVNNPVSSAVFSFNKAQNWIVEPTLEYITKISEGRFTALAGASWQHNTSKGQFLTGTNYSSEALLGTLSGAGLVTVNYNNIVEYKYNAFFGRLNYDWKGKYIVNATFRRDGSSRFGPNNRFGNFGAIGAAWVFSDEEFLKNSGVLSFGKLRGSYGTTGNDQISNYLYLPLYSSTTIYLNNPAILPVTLPNADIQWETTRKLEAAVDLGFFKNRILFTANYYRNRSSDQISFVSVPLQSGYNSITANLPAVIQNTGLELELSTTNISSKDFKWTTSLNLTFPNNKLVDFPNLASSFYSTSYIIGQPINLTRVYHYLGVDPTNGRATFEDIDKDGSITFANDRVIAPIGTPYYGGLNNSFSYKNLQFDFFFQFNHRFGATNILNTRPGALINQNTSYLNRWMKPGDVTDIPAATANAGSPIYTSYNNYTGSDAVWGDASYLKLRSANISYAIGDNLIRNLKMTNCRIFVEGQNLVTWSKNRYIFDTETQVQGGPSGLGTGTVGQVLPPLRTIVFGINCSF
ncbi:SusC/RagA family TonB-linked outer membrane protein [Segetibacter sp. 3557_3]|uniref:SusC/RagA family TonB-linked outer membrane protein n=1 Tax=Segetibacter sp. 3557_3 TaxID=2547429 RepID=UPI0010584997|nr:SusC/RagA family TonB-linked outer membrane protein [Segetibacter sp. 3557_3]TDH27044.1 SusC/RagA family TonB-linked outer membrane protein [Segetibacter sp. 3557_3]